MLQAAILRRLSLVSSFLSRRSNESSEPPPKVRTPSAAAAVDELEGAWTSYILYPELGPVDSWAPAADHANSDPALGLETNCFVRPSGEASTVSTAVDFSADNSSLGNAGDALQGSTWLTSALKERQEILEREKAGQVI